jgi:hypothetical protein
MSCRISKSRHYALQRRVIAACIALLGLALSENGAAQGAPLAGFVLVNMVASPDPIMASFNGKAVISSRGLQQGRATSGLGVNVGSGTVSVSHPELGSAEAVLEIKLGATPIVVAYAEIEPAKPGQPAKRRIALNVIPAKPSKEPLYRVFYAAASASPAADLMLNKQAVSLPPWRVQILKGRNLTIATREAEIGNLNMEGKDSCAVFIARDEDKSFFAVTVPEIIYTW